MRTDIVFFEPHQDARKAARPAPIPHLSINAQGRFRFNAAAAEALGLTRRSRVLLGCHRNQPQDWFLMLVGEGGSPLLNLNQYAPRKPVAWAFYSLPLRHQLLSTLPYAPPDGALVLKLDGLTHLEDDGAEIWPLMTAPYYLPPTEPVDAPAALEPPLHPRILQMMTPGLLAVRYQK